MTGIIAAALATGLIGALLLVGIRSKPPPLDLDWRERLPPHTPPPPPPTRTQVIVFFGRYGALIGAIVAASLHAGRVATTLMLVYLALILVWLAIRAGAGLRARRAVSG